MKTTRQYVRPVKYTPEELLAAKIADLETDMRLADRDGLVDYARECREELSRLQARCRVCHYEKNNGSSDGLCYNCQCKTYLDTD